MTDFLERASEVVAEKSSPDKIEKAAWLGNQSTALYLATRVSNSLMILIKEHHRELYLNYLDLSPVVFLVKYFCEKYIPQLTQNEHIKVLGRIVRILRDRSRKLNLRRERRAMSDTTSS